MTDCDPMSGKNQMFIAQLLTAVIDQR